MTDFFSSELVDLDEDELIDILRCEECGLEFEVSSGSEPEKCPHCNTLFD